MTHRCLLVRHLRCATLAATLAGALASSPASATDFLVNVSTSGFQEEPSVASDERGNTLVVWLDDGPAQAVVRARHYSPTGVAGPELTLSDASFEATPPAVSASAAGFLVVWGLEQSGMQVRGRRLTAAGLVSGAEIPVNELSFGGSSPEPRPVLFDDGGYVVVWSPPEGSGGDENDSTEARRFAPDGTPSPQFQVNSREEAYQEAPGIAARYGDGYVVTWVEDFSGADQGVRARRFGPRDGPLEIEQLVSPAADGIYEIGPRVTSSLDGSFVVAWYEYGQVGYGRRVSPSGTPDPLFPLASAPEWDVWQVGVGAEPWGAFTTVWSSSDAAGDDDDGTSIQRRTHAANGQPAGLEEQVNTHVPGTQGAPAVAVDGDGDVFFAWHSPSFGAADTDRAIVARRLPGPLAAAWRLDEGSGLSIFDSAGSFHDGGNVNGASFVDGRFGDALAFDGVDDYVFLGASTDLATVANEVAITAWIRPDVLGVAMPDDFGGIYDAIEDNYVLYLDKAAGELRFKITPASGPGFALRPGIPQAQLTAGRWHHVAGTFDGLEARIYLDGVFVDGESLASFSPVRAAPEQRAAIGRNGSIGVGSADYHFAGTVDELRVWRRAPSAAEILLMARPPLVRDGFESADAAGWHLVVP